MPVNFGSSAIASAYLGGISVSRMYLGSTLLYDGSTSTLAAAIASTFPYAPESSRSAIAAAAGFADAANPVGVINLLATAKYLVSCRLGDGCLFQGTDRTTPAITAGDTVGGLYSWHNLTAFTTQSNAVARAATTASSGLQVSAGKALSGTPFTGWTTGERIYIQRSSVDGATSGQFEGFGVNLAEAETLSFGSFATFSDSNLYDRWAFANTSGLTTSGTMRNPTVNLTSAFYALRTTTTSSLRTTQVNLETTATNSVTVSTPFLSHYSLGTRSGFGQNMNYLFLAAWDSTLSSSSLTLALRFLSNYCGLGLY